MKNILVINGADSIYNDNTRITIDEMLEVLLNIATRIEAGETNDGKPLYFPVFKRLFPN